MASPYHHHTHPLGSTDGNDANLLQAATGNLESFAPSQHPSQIYVACVIGNLVLQVFQSVVNTLKIHTPHTGQSYFPAWEGALLGSGLLL